MLRGGTLSCMALGWAESPAAVGLCMDPQSCKGWEGELGATLSAPYKTSLGGGEHPIKWTDIRFKWKTRTLHFCSLYTR